MKIASREIREAVVKAYLGGKASKSQLADIFGYHLSAINRWLRDFKRDNRLEPLPRGHLRTAFSENEQRQLSVLLMEQPDITIAEIKEKFAKNCSPSSVHRTIVALGFRYKKKHYSPVNKIERI